MFWLCRFLWRLVKSWIVLGLLGIALIFACWIALQPKPQPLEIERRELADRAARHLAESLPTPEGERPTLAVLPLERDTTGQVTASVRRAIARVDRYNVQPESWWGQFRRRLGFESKSVTPEAVDRVAREHTSADYLLAGKIQTLAVRHDNQEAVLDAVLVPVAQRLKSTPTVSEARYVSTDSKLNGWPSGTRHVTARASSNPSDASPARSVTSESWFGRLVGWTFLVLLSPLVVAPLLIRGLEKQSNAVNLAMLLGLTGVMGVTAFAITGFQVNTVGSAALVVAGVALALTYNWLVLSKLEELRG